jgi:4-amino-4-deoxy-L-arabinose transferase-like glycosyltransferase
MPEITKTKDQRPKTKDQIIWLLFALVILFIFFFGLSIPLLGPDEPRYAQVAREMFERGDWVTPTLGGFDWFEKPALLYWLQIASYHLFGVSEFAARFGSAVFGLGTILSLWILGRFLATEDTENHREIKTNEKDSFSSVNSVAGKDFANWLALIAASSIGLLVFSRGASFDIILTFPITASLVSFFIFDLTQSRKDAKTQTENSQKFYLLPFGFCLLFYFFIGVAIIAKGLIGIVFPFAIVGFYYVLSWKLPSKTFIFSLFWGTILSLLVASVWYLPMYQANDWKFIDEFFIQHHFQRYTSNKYQHPQPFWFFFLVLPLMTIPWLPFFLTSIYKVVNNQFTAVRKKLSTQHSELSTFAIAWLLVPLIFFSLSGSKLPGYILPALPAALILTAEYVFGFVQKSPKRKYALQILAFLTFAVIAVLLQFVVPKFAYADSTKSLIETANAKGYEGEKVVNLYTAVHNAEFYAAGRLLRETDGKLKRYDDFSVLLNDLKALENARILVLLPQKDVQNLIKDSSSSDIELLGENGDSAIILVKAK